MLPFDDALTNGAKEPNLSVCCNAANVWFHRTALAIAQIGGTSATLHRKVKKGIPFFDGSLFEQRSCSSVVDAK